MNNDFKILSLSALSSKYLSEIDEIRAKLNNEFYNCKSTDDKFIDKFDNLIEKLAVAKLKYDTISLYYYPNNTNNIKDLHNGHYTNNNKLSNDLIDLNTSKINNN